MTHADSSSSGPNEPIVHPPADIKKLMRQFNTAALMSRAAIFWERAWPRAVPPLSVAGLFLSASWAGLWQPLPIPARISGVVAFGITFGWALARPPGAFRTDSLLVTRREALSRLDDISGDPSRPATTLGDRPGIGSTEKQVENWNLHLIRTWERAGNSFRAGKPHPGLQKRDPHAVRYYILAAMLVTAAMASGQHIERVTAAFDWSTPVIPAAPFPPLQFRAWINPPETINREPLYIDNEKMPNTLSAHKNSTMTIRIFGRNPKITLNGADVPLQKEIKARNGGASKSEFQYELKLDELHNQVSIQGGPAWNFQITPDNTPTAEIISLKPGENPNVLEMDYTTMDDYGVKQSEIIITLPDGEPSAHPLQSGKIPALTLP